MVAGCTDANGAVMKIRDIGLKNARSIAVTDNHLTNEYRRLKVLQEAETGNLLPRKGHVNYWCEMDNAMLLIESLMKREAKLREALVSLKPFNYLNLECPCCGFQPHKLDQFIEDALYPSEYPVDR